MLLDLCRPCGLGRARQGMPSTCQALKPPGRVRRTSLREHFTLARKANLTLYHHEL